MVYIRVVAMAVQKSGHILEIDLVRLGEGAEVRRNKAMLRVLERNRVGWG